MSIPEAELTMTATARELGPMAVEVTTDTKAPGDATMIGKTYRHYKGGFYRVIAVGRLEATLEPVVVYQSSDGNGTVWVRTAENFHELVSPGVQRFTPVDSCQET